MLQFCTQWVLNSQPTIHLELTRGRVANWARAHWHFFFLFKTIKYAYLCYRDLKLCKLEPTAVHRECTENGPCTTVVSGPTDGRADKCVFWKMIMYVLSIIILIRNWYVAYLFDFWLIQYMGILIVCLSQICFRWFCNCRMNERNEFDNFLDEFSGLLALVNHETLNLVRKSTMLSFHGEPTGSPYWFHCQFLGLGLKKWPKDIYREEKECRVLFLVFGS